MYRGKNIRLFVCYFVCLLISSTIRTVFESINLLLLLPFCFCWHDCITHISTVFYTIDRRDKRRYIQNKTEPIHSRTNERKRDNTYYSTVLSSKKRYIYILYYTALCHSRNLFVGWWVAGVINSIQDATEPMSSGGTVRYCTVLNTFILNWSPSSPPSTHCCSYLVLQRKK